MKKAVFASVTGALSDQPPKFYRQVLAHPFLASLTRTYLRLHHTHQQFRLLVLI
jgi:hypothetical protein